MTITNGYCTLQQLQETMLPADFNQSDPNLERAINTASRWIDGWCGRRFYADGSATARTFRPSSSVLVVVDDISTTTGLVVKTDDGDSGTFGTTWVSTDYELEPTNGRGPGGQAWPYTGIRAVAGRAFYDRNRSSVQVTANWGWAAVPADVQQACIHMAEYVYKAKDAPFGAAGLGELGIITARLPGIVVSLLSPFRSGQATDAPRVA